MDLQTSRPSLVAEARETQTVLSGPCPVPFAMSCKLIWLTLCMLLLVKYSIGREDSLNHAAELPGNAPLTRRRDSGASELT